MSRLTEADTDPDATPDRSTIVDRMTGRSTPRPLAVARYQTRATIGRGGMGEVLTAYDDHVGREVALKRMRGDRPSEKSIDRFIREARIQGRLDHPAIVPVHDLGRDASGRPYFAMKKLTGVTLAVVLRNQHLAAKYPRQRLLRALADACLAIELAHTRGVIHRDIKPENLLLGDFGEVYVLDWGVAKVIDDVRGEFGDVLNTTSRTEAGTVIGTPGYMAPEQVRAIPDLDGRADVYSLGCVLFEILAGEPLNSTKVVTLRDVLLCDGVRPSQRALLERSVPPELDQLCMEATAVDRERRIRTARELGERIQSFLDGDRDLMLRTQLARVHLARAREAFANQDDETELAVAIREAGRALGLDPKLEGAADLVGRLMLEPPRTIPRQVERAIDDDDRQVNRRQARCGLWVFLGYLGFAPFLLGYESQLYVAVFTGLVVFNCVLAWRHGYARRYIPILDGSFVLIAMNMLIVAAVARVFSAIFLAPAMAGLTASALVNTPRYARARSLVLIVLAMLTAIAAPWVGEATGLLSRTFEITAGGPVFHHEHLLGGVVARTIGIGIYIVGVIAAGAALTYFVRKAERDTRRLLHLQTWQLKQLVPPAHSTSS
jgi:eukaryotic-like serine/threonine-protein kinase